MKSTQRMISILTSKMSARRRALSDQVRSRRITFHRKAFCALTLAAGMSLGTTGCVSSNPGSLFSMSPRPSQQPITTDRLISVARVFESQQNYGKAKQLYKLVVSQQPNNIEAIQQIAWIDSLGTGIPVSNPRIGAPAAAPQMYAQADYSRPAAPNNFAPQSVAEATKAVRMPAIPVVMSGTDPSTGEPFLIDSTGQLPPIEAAPLEVVAEEAYSTEVESYAPESMVSAPVGVAVEYPVESVEVNTVAQPIGTVSLNGASGSESGNDGEWAMPVSAEESVPVMPEGNSVTLQVEHPIEQLSGSFEDPMPTDTVAMTSEVQLGAIEQYVDHPEKSVPQLVQFLDDADPDIRSLAAFLIGETAGQGASALPVLNQRLKREPHEVIRITIAEAIAKVDSQSREAFMVMSECLDSDDAEIRSQAAFALRVYASAGHSECVTRLATSLTDANSNVRSMAALSLGDFGPSAATAIPALEAALGDDSSDVRDSASAALTRVKQ